MHEAPHPSFPIWFEKKKKPLGICLLQTAWRLCSWCFCFACQVDVFCFACGRCEEMRRKILSSDAMLWLFPFKLSWRAPQRSLIFHIHTIDFINSLTQQHFTEYIAVEGSFWSRNITAFLVYLLQELPCPVPPSLQACPTDVLFQKHPSFSTLNQERRPGGLPALPCLYPPVN